MNPKDNHVVGFVRERKKTIIIIQLDPYLEKVIIIDVNKNKYEKESIPVVCITKKTTI